MSIHARKLVLLSAAAITVLAAGLTAQNYIADTTYKGTSLAGWHVTGDATWRAENGEYRRHAEESCGRMVDE